MKHSFHTRRLFILNLFTPSRYVLVYGTQLNFYNNFQVFLAVLGLDKLSDESGKFLISA